VGAVAESPKKNEALTHFATTRWSLIRIGGAAGARGDANEGLAQLCQIYWRPIFTFIYRHGYSAQDAQDLTQDFFLVILEGTLLQSADPALGRFRSLLIRSLKNFLIDARVKRGTQKRGGGLQFVSWEEWMADAPCQLSISAQTLETAPAEALFDWSWAAAIAEEALRRLRMECESKGRRRVYEVLHRYLNTEREDISYQDLSGALGVPEPSVKSLLHQFRKRYRALLREEVAKTVESDADVSNEIRYLCATLSTRGG
jgi:RNA polymerase sigma factor (sigma-70 family)